MSNAIEQLEFKINEYWAQFARENYWVSFIPEFAKDADGQEFMKGRDRSVVYRIKTENEKEEQTYECTKCRGEILSEIVAHAIWMVHFQCRVLVNVIMNQFPIVQSVKRSQIFMALQFR